MKRAIALMLSISLLLTLCACGAADGGNPRAVHTGLGVSDRLKI